jgi:hypothetical protein
VFLKNRQALNKVGERTSENDSYLESLFKKAGRFRDAGNAIDLFWTHTITFLGVALSFGLLLNLFGHACIIDPEAGLRVDTIQELRKEKQFQLHLFDAETRPRTKRSSR